MATWQIGTWLIYSQHKSSAVLCNTRTHARTHTSALIALMHMLACNFAVGFARTVRAGVAYQAALSMHLHS